MSKQNPLFVPRSGYPNFILSVCMTTVKMLFMVILISCISLSGILMGIAKAWVDTTPNLDLDLFDSQAQTSFIYDKNGELITTFRGTENRVYCTYDELPENLINAVIAIEDARFWQHSGVDVKRYIGAFVGNLFSGNNQGGSTITCQLIKQTLLTSEQTYRRKVQEAYLALELEETLKGLFMGDVKSAKERILVEYMNVVYMGGSLYGVKTAALDYFGKDLNELSLKECALLAGMIRNPSRYNPRSNYYIRNTPEVSETRANYVLEQMAAHGFITDRQCLIAKNEQLKVLPSSTNADQMYDNAYYVEYAIYDVVTKMLRVEQKEDTSANRSAMESKLRTGGYHIYTSLDPTIQEAVQAQITNWKGYPSTRYSSDKYKKTLSNGEYVDIIQPQAACAVMDWHTGELIAIVGGRSEPTARKQLNRAHQLNMPVGSSIKPLSVYGPAFDMGWSPGTPVMNLPIRIEGWVSQQGYPNNYGGGGFTGCESMRMAINKSNNYSAAQALFQYVGISNSVNYLLKLGVSSSHIQATGSGLALGSSGISVIEMAAAFGAIANDGEYLEPYAFTEVLYNDNKTVYISARNEQVRRQAFKPSTAYMLVDVLIGCVSGTHGTGSRARFDNFTVAGKTGTNSDACGVFFAGMTGYYSCAVWIGHDSYKPLSASSTGGGYAAPLFSVVMREVHKLNGITQNKPIMEGTYSDYGLVIAQACGVSGMKPSSYCRNDANGYDVTNDYYLKGTEPTVTCNMHRQVTLCTRSNRRPSEYCTSVRSYGVLYIPQGHPLRQAETIKEVQRYFKGASVDQSVISYGTCSQCR
ncbi:MAG: transglycosylase domain-containing protein [Clostridia bacterium]|nr:transglycosylase domain-containing protein [Clostridia bacterium]